MKIASQYDVIVVGGGASGMMAAGVAAERGKRVLLLEKNATLGQKLKISGGGRCNVTNGETDHRVLLKNYGTAEKFLYSLFVAYDNQSSIRFFESRGLKLKTEDRKRMFPITDSAFDVFRVLEKELEKTHVVVLTRTKVLGFEMGGANIVGVKTDKGTYTAGSYILATGGLSHPETGSTGDGFGWLKKLGHTIVEPTPTIVPISVKEKWVKALSGITLTDSKITFYVDKVKSFQKKGNILCTHFGLSGPTILNSSSQVSDLLHTGEVTAAIDLFPALDHGTFEKKIIAVFDVNKNKMLKNVFGEIVPKGSEEILLEYLKIDGDTKVHSVTKEDRKKMVQQLKALPVTITGLMGFDRAVVADGGLPLTEIDTRTMRSNRIENLFVMGDLLHVRRPSGGYSLQLCWTTGYVAGMNV
jgi:predicted Rossmann fold flavoprotein